MKVLDLVASFSERGMQNAIHVRHKKGSDKLIIIDGHRRFRAATEAGLKMVRVIDHGELSNIDAVTVSHEQNFLRRKVTKKENMNYCRMLKKEGLGVTEIAQRLGLGKSTVSEYLTISRANPKLQQVAEKPTGDGGVSTKTALRAARLPEAQQKKAAPRLAGKTEKQAEVVLGPVKPKVITDPKAAPKPTNSIGVLMPGETLDKGYRVVSDYKERCQKMDIEVQKRLKQTPSNQRLQGMELVIGVLKGKLTVEQAFVNWQKV